MFQLNEKTYLSMSEVAHQLAISEPTARRYVRSMNVPVLKIGRSLYITVDDLESGLPTLAIRQTEKKNKTIKIL